tara:strand:+ start:56 stop:232 length:177 start_codon:yes stop_codon:yes gene_type:complete
MIISVYINGILKEVPIKKLQYVNVNNEFSFYTKFLFSEVNISINQNEVKRIIKILEGL